MNPTKKLSVILILLLALAPAARSQDVFELLSKNDVAAVKDLIEKTLRLVDFLVDKGAELEAKSAPGETPLMVAADGKYLFFLSQRDGESHAYWVRAHVIDGLGDRRKAGTER